MDLKSSAGEAMFTIISAIAKFERDMISERVKGGLRKTKEKGNRHGDALFLCDKKEVMQQDLLRL